MKQRQHARDGMGPQYPFLELELYTSQRQFPFICRVPWSPAPEIVCALPLDSGWPLPSPAFPPHQHPSSSPQPAKPLRNSGSESEMLPQTDRPGKVSRYHSVQLFLSSGVRRRKACGSKARTMFNRNIHTFNEYSSSGCMPRCPLLLWPGLQNKFCGPKPDLWSRSTCSQHQLRSPSSLLHAHDQEYKYLPL